MRHEVTLDYSIIMIDLSIGGTRLPCVQCTPSGGPVTFIAQLISPKRLFILSSRLPSRLTFYLHSQKLWSGGIWHFKLTLVMVDSPFRSLIHSRSFSSLPDSSRLIAMPEWNSPTEIARAADIFAKFMHALLGLYA